MAEEKEKPQTAAVLAGGGNPGDTLPGTSLTADQLLSLQYTPYAGDIEKRNSGAAGILRRKAMRTLETSEPQDPRLRVGSYAQRTRDDVRALLDANGLHPDVDASVLARVLNRNVASGADPAEAARAIWGRHPELFTDTGPTRSADKIIPRSP